MLEELGLIIGCLVAALVAACAWAFTCRRVVSRRLVNHIEFFEPLKDLQHSEHTDKRTSGDTHEKDTDNQTTETAEQQRELHLNEYKQTYLPPSVLGFGEPKESPTATSELHMELKPGRDTPKAPVRPSVPVTRSSTGGSLLKSIGKTASEMYETEVKNEKESKEAARKAKEEEAKKLAEKKEAEKKEAEKKDTKSGVPASGFAFNFDAKSIAAKK